MMHATIFCIVGNWRRSGSRCTSSSWERPCRQQSRAAAGQNRGAACGPRCLCSKVHLVDLAGSDADKRDLSAAHSIQQRKESSHINKDLLATKECISGIARKYFSVCANAHGKEAETYETAEGASTWCCRCAGRQPKAVAKGSESKQCKPMQAAARRRRREG
jgi:hypothetical protein